MSDIRPTRLGKFELLARIAKGGMAEIFLARQSDRVGLSRLVVVKRILPHLAEEAPFVEMFLEEARLAALISHPNVVQIYDVGESEGDFYIAMEYIDGPSVGVLTRRARQSKIPVPPLIAAEIVAQSCDGLHAAHELRDEGGVPLGLVHRDISPHNLMLTRNGMVKLLDFGVAKAQDSAVKTNTGSIKGKFPYMSPEQCRGDNLDRRTDVFSLGVVFYELVCAERLFQRPTDLMTLKAITEDPLPLPRDRNPELPEELSEVIRRALSRDRDVRYSDAAQFGQALRSALAGLGERTSAKTLATYVEERFGDELEQRAATLREVSRKPTGAHVAVVEQGFGSSRSASASLASMRSLERQTGPLDGDSISSVYTVDERPPNTRSSTVNRPDGGEPRSRRWLVILVAGVLLCGLAVAAGFGYRYYRESSRPSGPALVFGIAPVYKRATMNKELAPFLRYLERRVERRIDLRVTRNYADLRKQLLEGAVHIATISPLLFVRLRREHPAIRVLAGTTHEGARHYQAYLMVRADSGLDSLEQLRGKRICYVDRGSGSGYLMPRYFLRKKGLNPDSAFAAVRMSGSHEAVLRDLLASKCDVGATYSEAYRGARKLKIRTSALKILQVTGDLPMDVVCASPKLDRRTQRRLQGALIAFDPQRDIGRRVLGDFYPIDAFVDPRLADFAALEAAERTEGRVAGKLPESASQPSSSQPSSKPSR